MFQSYWSAYNILGEYGFYKFDSDVIRDSLQLLDNYKQSIEQYNEKIERWKFKSKIDGYNKIFEFFTGVDKSKHWFTILSERKTKNIAPTMVLTQYTSLDFDSFFVTLKVKFLLMGKVVVEHFDGKMMSTCPVLYHYKPKRYSFKTWIPFRVWIFLV